MPGVSIECEWTLPGTVLSRKRLGGVERAGRNPLLPLDVQLSSEGLC
jgi:hypothetical protein